MVALTTLARRLGRRLLVVAAACGLPFAAHAVDVYTPFEVAQRFEQQVRQKLQVPTEEVRLYGLMAELQLMDSQQTLHEPQYLLVVDSNPHVQAAFVFWRLLPGRYELVGAAPVSTGAPLRSSDFQTPAGLFEVTGTPLPPAPASACRTSAAAPCGEPARIYDFGLQRVRRPTGPSLFAERRLLARAADVRSTPLLGSAQSDGSILLPPTLIAFLDELGVLDAAQSHEDRAQAPTLPFRGRYLLVIDSERDERPEWSPQPLLIAAPTPADPTRLATVAAPRSP